MTDSVARALVWALLPLGPFLASVGILRRHPSRRVAAVGMATFLPAVAVGLVVGWAAGGSLAVAAFGKEFSPLQGAAALALGETVAGFLAQAGLVAAVRRVLDRLRPAGRKAGSAS
ncbi:hypothetical protein L6R50_04430 [Myxococcota bacterium]|nr:hypothetical protein [Myxococcota bacterium]